MTAPDGNKSPDTSAKPRGWAWAIVLVILVAAVIGFIVVSGMGQVGSGAAGKIGG